jgi:pyruvate formate lyase activating enzyme
VYRNNDGILHNLNYARVSAIAIDPIEKKPLFHFHPGTTALSIGGWGCNFHCAHCQNWQISCQEPVASFSGSQELLPEAAITLARQHGTPGIVWTYNEPTVWFEYTLDSAKLAKAHNLYTAYVTNGYITPEALDAIGPYLDAWRVDVKGFSDGLYQRIAGIRNWRSILDTAVRAKEKWGMHVEVITNIIPTMNDDEAQLSGIARWIHDSLGELTPWHVTRFYPQYQMQDLPPTPLATIDRAIAIGKSAGLKFIYPGNIPGHKAESTCCYHCGRDIVARNGYRSNVSGLDGTKCRYCGAELNFLL